MNKWFKYLSISIVIILLDQISKILVRKFIAWKSIPVWGEFFKLTHVQNTGAAFSISLGSPLVNRVFFIIITLVFLVILYFIMKKTDSKTEMIAYSMVIGGAIGNLIDRIVYGSVTDFFDCDFPDFIMERFAIFNIADSSIVIAITILVIYYLFFEKKPLEGQ